MAKHLVADTLITESYIECHDKIYAHGDIISKKDVFGFSDVRLKMDLTKIENCLDKLRPICGYTYI